MHIKRPTVTHDICNSYMLHRWFVIFRGSGVQRFAATNTTISALYQKNVMVLKH